MHKVSRIQLSGGATRKDRPRKRKQSFNPKTPEIDDDSFLSSSGKKLKSDTLEHVPEEATLQYSIIDFAMVFSTLSCFVRCSNSITTSGESKLCNGRVDFKQCSKFGLGFKIVVECERCHPKYILSCQKIGRAYELNRRFIFVMRILGLGLAGCKKFCGLMDISSSFVNQSTYDFYVDKIHGVIRRVADLLFSSAAEQEKQLAMDENDGEDTIDMSVSGDGTWKIVDIAALIAGCIFNEGASALLLIMHSMDLKLGRNSHEYARKSDGNRICAAERKSANETREARIRHRQEQKDALDIAAAAGCSLYGPGIDDSM